MLLGYVTSPILFYIIDTYIFINNNTYTHTYSQYIYIPIEYFVNREKYIYAILLHFLVFGLVTFTVVIAIATFLGLYVRHACGLLKIAR